MLIELVLALILLFVVLVKAKNSEKYQSDIFQDPLIRANPWIGFIQEDIYKDPNGPIGDFQGKSDVLSNLRPAEFT